MNVKDFACLIPTWVTARHALGAYNSFHKYYPDIPVYFVDDESTQENDYLWHQLAKAAMGGRNAFDKDSSKLIGLENSCYIFRKHTGFETEGHGQAITYAMQFIHKKWIVHLSADVRIIKEGCLEFLMDGVDDRCCGTGEDFTREGPPNVAKWLCIFRGDLYHQYDLDFHGDLSKLSDAGAWMFGELVKKGYPLNFTPSGMGEYYVHLTNIWNEAWEKYY